MRDLSETGVHARGKQRLDRGTIWYTAQSGIWQTVWLEAVPASYVERLVLTPHLDSGELEVTVVASGAPSSSARLTGRGSTTVTVLDDAPSSARRRPAGSPGADPAVRRAPVVAGRPAPLRRRGDPRRGPGDLVRRACARSGSAGTTTATRGCCSTASRCAHVGVLDQGYWPDGLLTPPSDAAMVHDIETMKSLGFNDAAQAREDRAAALVRPLRPARHAGLAGHGQRRRPLPRTCTTTRPATTRDLGPRPAAPALRPAATADGRAEFRREVRETVELLRNVVVASPCGRRSTRAGASSTPTRSRAGSPTSTPPGRSTTPAAGSTRAAATSASFHAYLRPFAMPARAAGPARGGATAGWSRSPSTAATACASRATTGARASSATATSTTPSRSARASLELHEPLADAVRRGLAATVYTQLSDVEDELNGLLTWDREVLKIDADVDAGRRVTARLHP